MKVIDVCRFYHEAVRINKKLYAEHPDKCPFHEFGMDLGKIRANL